MANEIAWQVESSVDTDVRPSFAWSFCTNVKNWDDPPAQFLLDGPFAAGSQGTRLLPGQEPVRWRIRDLRPGQSYVIETRLDRATLCFEWCFEALSECRTRLTQRIVLSGEGAAEHVAAVSGFGSNLEAGMEKIAAAIAAAQAVDGDASEPPAREET